VKYVVGSDDDRVGAIAFVEQSTQAMYTRRRRRGGHLTASLGRSSWSDTLGNSRA
jgi:hypothetical protein